MCVSADALHMDCFLRHGLVLVAQAGLKLTILLPQPPEYWDYRCMPPCLAAYGLLKAQAHKNMQGWAS
jgi:hypothetical protein